MTVESAKADPKERTGMIQETERTPTNFISSLAAILDKTRKTLNGFFYGMTAYGLQVELRKEKSRLNNLLMLIVFGDIVGVPIFPPYFSLRLLPFIIPHMSTWKRNIQREKDLTDMLSDL